MSEPVLIPDIMRSIVSAASLKLLAALQLIDPLITGVHFEYGHINDIRERVVTYGQNIINYCPLVCLIEDYKVKKGAKIGVTGITDMKIIILYFSKKDILRQQREDNVFKPILYPVYNELMKQLKLSGKFMIYDVSTIKHDMIPRPHWGDPGLYGNDAYLLNGVFDGIELSNLELTTFLNNCQ